MTDAAQPATDSALNSGKPTMNEQWEGQGSEYFATPIVIPDIKVVGPRVLVKQPKLSEYKTEHGIVVPESAQERVSQGLILMVGDGVAPEGSRWDEEERCWKDPKGWKVKSRYVPGMEILYARYAGAEISLYGETYLIVNEADIRCILEEYQLNDEEGA